MTVDLSNVNADVVAVSERASNASWHVQWIPRGKSNNLAIWIPNGRTRQSRVVGRQRAKMLLATEFEQFRWLGSYVAINNPTKSYFEAELRSSADTGDLSSLRRISGAEPGVDRRTDLDSSDEASDARDEPTEHWRLTITDDRRSWSVEFSGMSDEFLALTATQDKLKLPLERRPTTIKIYGVDAPHHEDAVRRLEEISGAVFFDLDLLYGLALELDRVGGSYATTAYVPSSPDRPPSLPRLRYPPGALSLYNYGRSASGLPLLQFLAYYQVLEFFFPTHFRQSVLRRMRHELTDPRFDATDDASLARLLNITTVGGRAGYGSERDQLNATIAGSVDEQVLHEFLRRDPERLKTLGDRAIIKGVPVVNEANRDTPIIDQVAARIYAIRCRIVHTKSDGPESSADLLLPGTSEAHDLAQDVSVLKFIAQKAIIAGGSTMR